MINKKRSARKIRRYIPYIAVIAFSFAIFVIVILPFGKRTIDAFQEARKLESQVDALRNKLLRLNSIDEVNLERDFSVLASAVPTNTSLISIILAIHKASELSGVELTSFTIEFIESTATESVSIQREKERVSSGFTSIPLSVVIAGDFDMIESFLRIIQETKRLMSVRFFNIEFDTENNRFKGTISLESFYLPLSKKRQQETLRPITNEEYEVLSKVQAYQDVGGVQLGSADAAPTAPLQGRANPFSLE